MSKQAYQECSVIDLFCGVGGLTHGFVLEGFNVVAGVDSDGACKFAYEQNNNSRFIHQRLENIMPQKVAELYPEGHGRILVGCAPCQPFSQYKKKKGAQDDKWKLLDRFADFIDVIQPQVVSMENVPELLTFSGGQVFGKFVERLSKNYSVTTYTAFCPEYDVPQNRTRLVLFASKHGAIELITGPKKNGDYRTVRDAIGHLPPLAAGAFSPSDPLHRASKLSELNLRRISQSKPGGTWRDWEKSLVAKCHLKDSGKSYDSVYGRMSWDRPAPTITTQCNGYGNGRFGHPEQNRAISMREAAILQTFPDNYEFCPSNSPFHVETIARLVGNAVPVNLARAIAASIRQHLEGCSDFEAGV